MQFHRDKTLSSEILFNIIIVSCLSLDLLSEQSGPVKPEKQSQVEFRRQVPRFRQLKGHLTHSRFEVTLCLKNMFITPKSIEVI